MDGAFDVRPAQNARADGRLPKMGAATYSGRCLTAYSSNHIRAVVIVTGLKNKRVDLHAYVSRTLYDLT